MAQTKCNAQVTVSSPLGLHGRPAAMLVQLASRYRSKISLCRPEDPDNPADCRSILSLLVLAATQGTDLLLCAEGEDAPEAVAAITEFFSQSFQE